MREETETSMIMGVNVSKRLVQRHKARCRGEIREAVIRAISYEVVCISTIMTRARVSLPVAKGLLVELKLAGLVCEMTPKQARKNDDRLSVMYCLTEYAKSFCREMVIHVLV